MCREIGDFATASHFDSRSGRRIAKGTPGHMTDFPHVSRGTSSSCKGPSVASDSNAAAIRHLHEVALEITGHC